MHATKAYGKRRLCPFILNLGTLELSGQLHAPDSSLLGKDPHYPLNKSLGGPQSQSGLFQEKINASLVPGFLRYLADLDRSLVTVHIALCSLQSSINREYGMIPSLWSLSLIRVHKLQCFKGSYLLKVYFL